MTKLYIEAIRALPIEFVADGTEVLQVDDHRAFAVHHLHAPIVYENGVWSGYVLNTNPGPVVFRPGYTPAFCSECKRQIMTGISAQFGAAPMPTICTDCALVKA